MLLKLVKYSKKYLSKSSIWLSDDEIKKMTNAPDLNYSEQLNWFNSLEIRDNYQIWGIELNKNPIGACGLKNITKNDAEYWGYIGEKSYWGKGLGKIILSKTLQKAKELDVESIWLKVNKSNIRAINLYKKAGFKFINESDNISEFIMKIHL